MKLLKHKLIFFISSIIFLCSFNVTCFANATKVNDNAKLLSQDEISKIESTITAINSKYNIDVAIVTTNNIGNKSYNDYCEDFYITNDYGIGTDRGGLLLLIDIGNRHTYIYHHGGANKYFPNSRVDNIINDIKPNLTHGNYSQAINTFLKDVNTYMKSGVPSSNHKEYKDIFKLKTMLIYGGISFLIALTSCIIVVFKYKSPKPESGLDYLDHNSINFTNTYDNFIGSSITKIPIPKSNSDSSSSSDSSGSSDGGSGSDF
jgi:uncharacterized protein